MADQRFTLALRKITHWFDRHGGRVLDNVNLICRARDRVCLVGPSGSGKTTLLNVAGGLLRPTEGQVLVNGVDICSVPDREVSRLRARDFGLVFQSPNLIPVMSVRENVDIGLQLAFPEISEHMRRARVGEVLALTGLVERSGARPNALSGGECQRVALARAVVKRPRILLADEPTSNLDDENCDRVRTLLATLSSTEGTAVVIATHDKRLLGSAERTVWMSGGRVGRTDIVDIGGEDQYAALAASGT